MHAPQSSRPDGEIAAGLTQMIRHYHNQIIVEEVTNNPVLQKMLSHEEPDACQLYWLTTFGGACV
jgi:hypothetical protein